MKRRNKKILITGGAGYIGLNLISFFLETKNKIYVIDNLSTSKAINKNIKKYINFYKIDLTDEKRVKRFFKKRSFDLIIHLAAFSGVQEFNKNILKSFNNKGFVSSLIKNVACIYSFFLKHLIDYVCGRLSSV